ncbi:MAG: hypothetical protein J7K59_00305 [Candidatus Korarchaeota archaeon]|nr:hypothetical protein [Candidatus Korarchaeota archaeon]
MIKKNMTFILALILILATMSGLMNHTLFGKLEGRSYQRVSEENLGDSNISFIPATSEGLQYLVNVTLENGSRLAFKTPDAAMLELYTYIKTGALELSDINKTEFVLFHDYIANSSENTMSQPIEGYEVFFSEIENSQSYNYTGKIVAVNSDEFYKNTYGIPFTKTFLYGKVKLPTGKLSNGTAINSDSFLEYDQLLVVYLDSNDAMITQTLAEELQKLVEEQKNIIGLIIDISNNATSLVSLFNSSNILLANNNEIELNGVNDSFTKFFGCPKRTPAQLYIDVESCILWRKSIGLESYDTMAGYLSVWDLGPVGLAAYPILKIETGDLIVGDENKLTIVLGDGFGNISFVEIGIELIDKHGQNINTLIKNASVVSSRVFEVSFIIDNGTAVLRLNITVEMDFDLSYGLYDVSFNLIVPEENLGGAPLADLTPIILAVAAALVIGIIIYRRVKKERSSKI